MKYINKQNLFLFFFAGILFIFFTFVFAEGEYLKVIEKIPFSTNETDSENEEKVVNNLPPEFSFNTVEKSLISKTEPKIIDEIEASDLGFAITEPQYPILLDPAPIEPIPSLILPNPIHIKPMPEPILIDPIPIDPAPLPILPNPIPIESMPEPILLDPIPVGPVPSPIFPDPISITPIPIPILPDPISIEPIPAPILPSQTAIEAGFLIDFNE